MSPFLTKLFHFLLDFHDSHAKAVRFRVCQIINKLFHGLDDEASIDEDLAGRVYDCMLVRLTDKFPAIRVQAVKAIYRLQDVQDPECPVIESFLHLMEKDSSPDVRRAALTSIAVTHKTVRAIIGEHFLLLVHISLQNPSIYVFCTVIYSWNTLHIFISKEIFLVSTETFLTSLQFQ